MKTRLRLVAPLVVAGLALSACGSKDQPESADSATTSAAPATTTPETAATSTPPTTGGSARNGTGSTTQVAAGVIVVKTDTDSQLGQILVDGSGLTLYAYNKDGVDSSSCNDTCAKSWIPLTGTSIQPSSDLNAADFVLINRSDGTKQVSYKGHPLYHFSSDKKAGQSNGQGVNRTWYVMGADGNPISKD